MRELFVICCCVTCFAAVSGRVYAEKPSGEQVDAVILDATSTLTALKLTDGCLRMDLQRWKEASYPPDKGDQHEQLLADTDNHRMSAEVARHALGRKSDHLLSLFAARKQLTRIKIASRAHSSGDGYGNGANMEFSNDAVSAAYYVEADPYARITISHSAPETRELVIDDNPAMLFRLLCRRGRRVGLLSQNRAGRIQFVFDSGEESVAMQWGDYAEMLADGEGLPSSFRSDLSSFAVTLPEANSTSSLKVPPSNLRDGPLPSVRSELGQLSKLHLAGGRIALDRQHWTQAANHASPSPPTNKAGDPFGRAAFARRRANQYAGPLDRLISHFGSAMNKSGMSRSSSSGISVTQFNSDDLAARFLNDSKSTRIQMSFVERTRHARLMMIDDTPGQSFSLLFSDPDYTILLTQGAGEALRLAYCDRLAADFVSHSSYGDLLKSDNPGLKLFQRLLEVIGVELPG